MSWNYTRPSYSMVAFTLTTIACVAALAHCSRRLIPQPEPTELIQAPGAFVQAGARQAVKWRTLDDDPFNEALRLDKPLMIVIGAAYDRAGAQFDRSLFADLEIAERINLDYIPVRIDADLNPEWTHSLLPLHDNRNGIDPSFQIWFISPEWVILNRYASGLQGYRFGFNEFVNLLGEARLNYIALRRSPEDQPSLSRLQAEDLAQFGRERSSLPSLTEYVMQRQEALREVAGWPVRGGIEVGFYDLELLLQMKGYEPAAEYVRRVLESPTFDWQGMGPNIGSEGNDFLRPELSQTAPTSASFARTLATLGVVGVGPEAEAMRELARLCLDSWFDSYVQVSDLLHYRFALQSYVGRSDTLSIPPAILRQRMDSAERAEAREMWNVAVESNPHVLPYPSAWPQALSPRATHLLELLRGENFDDAYTYGDSAPASTGFYATARVIEAALLLGDTDRVGRAVRAYEKAKSLRSGLDDVLRTSQSGVRPHRVLADYVAFSEAAYWAFLATGDVRELEAGRAVLRRAIGLFMDEDRRELSEIRMGERPPGRRGVGLPKAFDWLEPSSIGSMIHTCYIYGRLLDDADLIDVAEHLRGRYSAVYIGQSRGAGMYLRGLDRMESDTVVYVTGLSARADADALRRLAPDRVVVPALGGVGAGFAVGEERSVVVVRRGESTRFEFGDAVRMLGG